MSRFDPTLRLARPLLLAAGGFAAGCGGGGGGGDGVPSGGVILADVKYGRLVDDGSGARVVSPLTTVEVDPETGRVIPGTLQPLASGIPVDTRPSLGIGPDYVPRVVPRNGVLELEFSGPLDPDSVSADEIDASGAVVRAGSIQVRTHDDRAVAVALALVAPNVVRLDPRVGGAVGFPASPVDFGPSGEPRGDATGVLKLRFARTGGELLRSADGRFLAPRPDRLGEPATPIGFNPGNRVLDFIATNELVPTLETFNGFLPDLEPPRIVRTHAFEETLSFADGDGTGADTLLDLSAAFSPTAKEGAGEWAGGRLILRPGDASEETHRVAGNTRYAVTIDGTFAMPPRDGDGYRLERPEHFEPDLADPVDPERFDPDNPENGRNTDLANFVAVFEIDAQGGAVSGPYTLRDRLPSFSELRVRFSEPMAADSFLQWETFQVTTFPDGGEGRELLTAVFLDPTQTVATIRPARVDSAAGTFEVVGWGGGARTLQLVIQTVPKLSFLQHRMQSFDLLEFVDEGQRSLLDLGGQPLAHPRSTFDPSRPWFRFASSFATDEAASTQAPPPVVESWGVIVHRMRGRPRTGVDPVTGAPGVAYRDQPDFYGPIPDVNLLANGVLAGAAVTYLTKIHDDYFPPKDAPLPMYAFGVAAPLSTPHAAPGPQAHDGARFQTVWRDLDCSPSRDALAGTLLDLYRVSWAPIGGNVTSDQYDNVSIHCEHSPIRPSSYWTHITDGFQLNKPFDYDTWIEFIEPEKVVPCVGGRCEYPAPHHWGPLQTCVAPGTPYAVSQSQLFTPPDDGHAYHPWPEFDVPFQYNNGAIPREEIELRDLVNRDYDCPGREIPWRENRYEDPDPEKDNFGGDSLLFEVRIRPQKTAISRRNGFAFSPLQYWTNLPNFRVWSVGHDGSTLDPDDVVGTQGARCATGQIDISGDPWGDNARYFAVFDYVKTTSRITSPYVAVEPPGTAEPDFHPPMLDPLPSGVPFGTSMKLEFEGATGIHGENGTGFSESVDVADSMPSLAFRVTLVGNRASLSMPVLDTIAIPYRRPFGE